MLYFGRFAVPDPFIAFAVRGKKIAVVSALEFGRAKKTSGFDTVLPLEPWLDKARKAFPRAKVGPAEVIAVLACAHKVPAFAVPADFPAGLCDRLRAIGLKISVSNEPFFPQRMIKTAAEAAALREGNRCSALGLAAAERLLRACTIRDGKLFHGGSALTSERLQTAVEIACLEAGAVSLDTIAAGGDQACDPHERGHGPLRAHELIIVDVFPRVTATGYHGDMTRTFLRGRATDAQRSLVAAVREAQLAALGKVRAAPTAATSTRLVSMSSTSTTTRPPAPPAAPPASSMAPVMDSDSMSTNRRACRGRSITRCRRAPSSPSSPDFITRDWAAAASRTWSR